MVRPSDDGYEQHANHASRKKTMASIHFFLLCHWFVIGGLRQSGCSGLGEGMLKTREKQPDFGKTGLAYPPKRRKFE
jgi:hypothetical protein